MYLSRQVLAPPCIAGHLVIFFAIDIQKVIFNTYNSLLIFSIIRNLLERLASDYCFTKDGGTT
jgi:hypothetical protein